MTRARMSKLSFKRIDSPTPLPRVSQLASSEEPEENEEEPEEPHFDKEEAKKKIPIKRRASEGEKSENPKLETITNSSKKSFSVGKEQIGKRFFKVNKSIKTKSSKLVVPKYSRGGLLNTLSNKYIKMKETEKKSNKFQSRLLSQFEDDSIEELQFRPPQPPDKKVPKGKRMKSDLEFLTENCIRLGKPKKSSRTIKSNKIAVAKKSSLEGRLEDKSNLLDSSRAHHNVRSGLLSDLMVINKDLLSPRNAGGGGSKQESDEELKSQTKEEEEKLKLKNLGPENDKNPNLLSPRNLVDKGSKSHRFCSHSGSSMNSIQSRSIPRNKENLIGDRSTVQQTKAEAIRRDSIKNKRLLDKKFISIEMDVPTAQQKSSDGDGGGILKVNPKLKKYKTIGLRGGQNNENYKNFSMTMLKKMNSFAATMVFDNVKLNDKQKAGQKLGFFKKIFNRISRIKRVFVSRNKIDLEQKLKNKGLRTAKSKQFEKIKEKNRKILESKKDLKLKIGWIDYIALITPEFILPSAKKDLFIQVR